MAKPQGNKKFNLSIVRAFKIKNGFWSTEIDEEAFEALQQVRKGGKLVFKELSPESRKSDKSPHGYFEYMSPEEVAEFKTRQGQRTPNRDEDSGF